MAKKTTKKSPAGSPSVKTRQAKVVPQHLRDRVLLLKQRLVQQDTGADAVLVTNPRDIRYLTGFVGDDSWALVPLSPKQEKLWILSDFRFEEQIGREAPHTIAVMRKKGLVEELAKLAKSAKVRRIGLQPGHVSLALAKKLRKEIGRKRLVEVEDKLLDQRAVKHPDEARAIHKALEIQQQAFNELRQFIEPGMTESDLAAFLEYRMRGLGADGPSFSTIVAADANAALPHAIPGQTRVKKNGMVLVDWGARWGGYCGDLTRVIALGKMPGKIREIYKVVLDAQLAAIDAIKPGLSLRDADKVARDIIKKAGYEEQFGHSLGHGIGLDIHEQPTLSARAEEGAVLEPGHIVTVEPGIYLPGVGGVRIEDDVLVTSKGGQVLSDLPKDLESAII